MQLFGALDDNIRNFRHHINTDGAAVAVLDQLIPHRRGDVPQNHAAVALFHLVKNRVGSG